MHLCRITPARHSSYCYCLCCVVLWIVLSAFQIDPLTLVNTFPTPLRSATISKHDVSMGVVVKTVDVFHLTFEVRRRWLEYPTCLVITSQCIFGAAITLTNHVVNTQNGPT